MKGTPRVVGAWLAITSALTLTVLINPGFVGLADIRGSSSADMIVQIEGQRWLWKVAYENGAVSQDELVVPVDTRIRFDVTSTDVLHLFWIPAFGMKIDTVPGRTTEMFVMTERVGDSAEDSNLRVQCAELCGLSHSLTWDAGSGRGASGVRYLDGWLVEQRNRRWGRKLRMRPLVQAIKGGIGGYLIGALVTWAIQGSGSMSDPVPVTIGVIFGLIGWLMGIGVWNVWVREWLGLPVKDRAAQDWRRYFQFTTDHKVIGAQYLVTFIVVFLLGGVMAMVIRLELAGAGEGFIDEDTYNKVMSMHGILMVAVAVAGILGSFGNYLVPLMIGARDMAFPTVCPSSYGSPRYGDHHEPGEPRAVSDEDPAVRLWLRSRTGVGGPHGVELC